MARFLRKLKHTPQNILVARTDKIGDFILTLPVFAALKSELDLNFTVLCAESNLPLLQNNPHVDKSIAVQPDTQALVADIQSRNFDCLLVLVNDPLMRKFISKLRFIPTRIGPLSRPKFILQYTHPVIQKRSRSVMNEAEYNLELLEIFGKKAYKPARPKLYFTDAELGQTKASLTSKLGLLDIPPSFLVFHQGMSGSALNWEESNYTSLLEKALGQGLVVVLSGSTDDESRQNQMLYERFHTAYPNQLFNLSGRMALREFCVLINLAFLFIGPSTGPTHLANAVGTEIISFYPPIQVQSATRWQPYQAEATIFTPKVDCGQKHRCLGEKCKHFYCMNTISVDEVFETLLKIVKKRR